MYQPRSQYKKGQYFFPISIALEVCASLLAEDKLAQWGKARETTVQARQSLATLNPCS